jgi:tetratricopeptide (TPR) repeat protein
MPTVPVHRLSLMLLLGALLFATPAPAGENEIKAYETALAKATLAVENSDYQEAVNLFKQALSIKPKDKEAMLGLGIAYSRSGDLQAAKSNLLRTLTVEPDDARALYEIGVVMYKLGSTGEARDFFSAAREKSRDASLKTAAQNYLALMPEGAGEGKKFSLGLSAGFQYDSNVILEPDNPIAATQEKKSDMRGVLTVDGVYRFFKSNALSADAGYSFYQSVHHRIHDFNVQQHALKLAVTRILSGTAQTGLKYNFTYNLAGGSKFSAVHEVAPYITLQLLPKSLTEFHFIFDNSRYYNTAVFPGNAEQTGADRTMGFIHMLRLSEASTVSAGYDFDVNDANARSWSYRGQKGILGLRSVLGDYTAEVAVSYYDQRFRDTGPGYERHDGTQEYSAGLSRKIGDNLTLTLNDLYTIRDSNISVYEYTRNIVGFFVVTRL